MPDTPHERNLPSGLTETLPLAGGIVAVSIPVGLLAVAAVTGSVAVLVVAVVAMFAVGGTALTFIMLLAGQEPDDGDEGGE